MPIDDINAAAVTPGLALLNWNGAMAAEHPVTSLGADPLLLQSVATSDGPDGPRQMARLVSAEVSRARQAVDDLNLLTSAVLLQGLCAARNPSWPSWLSPCRRRAMMPNC